MPKDADLYFRLTSAGNLTADEAGSTHILDLGPGGVRNAVAWIRVPSITSTDTLDAKLQFDDSSSIASPDHETEFPQITAAGYYTIAFSTTRRYVGLDLDITDVGGGGFSAGAVEAGITLFDYPAQGARP